jgi:hypothetical protein
MEKKQSNDASRSRVAAESGGSEDQNQFRNAQAEGAPAPSDLLPALDEGQLSVLRRVGREWDRVSGDPRSGDGPCRWFPMWGAIPLP